MWLFSFRMATRSGCVAQKPPPACLVNRGRAVNCYLRDKPGSSSNLVQGFARRQGGRAGRQLQVAFLLARFGHTAHFFDFCVNTRLKAVSLSSHLFVESAWHTYSIQAGSISRTCTWFCCVLGELREPPLQWRLDWGEATCF